MTPLDALPLHDQATLVLAALVLFTSFALLGQSRMFGLIKVFAWQGGLLAITAALVAFSTGQHHLYVSAALTFALKALLIPWMLRRIVVHLGVRHEIEVLVHQAPVLLAGAALVVFSYYVSLPIVHLSTLVTRNSIGVSALGLTLTLPAAGAALLGATGERAFAPRLNVAVSAATLLASIALALQVLDAGSLLTPGRMLYVDAFNVYLIVLTAFVGLTTAVFSRVYMERERGRVRGRTMGLYHGLYQAFLFTMLLALSTNNLGVLWVALEAATLATVLLVSLDRTPEAVEAAWKYFILCGVGIAQALFGTVLLYFAQERLVGVAHETALSWHDMYAAAGQLEPTVLVLAFVFLLVGYGTKIGLVPLHNWLPDAHSEGPTPISAVLSGLLLNVALYAVVRVKMIVDGSLATHAGRYDPQLAGYLLMGFGLLSFMVAGLFLHRQRDVKRLFSYSSIEHMGLMTFAFGVGGPLATFGALLHMAVHSLTKSAIFVVVGHAAQIAGSQAIDNIRGLIRAQPGVGWALLVATAAIAGFPPFGVFVSEFLLLTATMKSWPWLTLPLLVGLGVALAGLFRHLQPMVFGEPTGNMVAVRANLWPVALHIAVVLALGLAIPGFLAGWFDSATRLIAGEGLP